MDKLVITCDISKKTGYVDRSVRCDFIDIEIDIKYKTKLHGTKYHKWLETFTQEDTTNYLNHNRNTFLTFFNLTFSSLSDFSLFFAFLSRSLAANFRLNKCSDIHVKVYRPICYRVCQIKKT